MRHLSPGWRDALGPNVLIESRGPHLKMALVEPVLQVSGVDNAVRLSHADVNDLRSLYKVGYPANWFDPRQIDLGYYGVRVNGELVTPPGACLLADAARRGAWQHRHASGPPRSWICSGGHGEILCGFGCKAIRLNA